MMNILLRLHTIFLCEIIFNRVSSQTTYTCFANASCGCSAKSVTSTKIVGGESATSLTWGWIVSLRYVSGNAHFCAGTIISSSHILTTAHCTIGLSSPSLIRVFAGSIYLSEQVQTRAISKIYNHPNYSATTFVNDIAILKLSSPLDLDQASVDVICLPNVSPIILSNQEYPPANVNLTAIGWGYLNEGGDAVSPILQQVTIQSVAANSIYCEDAKIEDWFTQLCAGTMPNGQKDTCQGDSGGPLMMFTAEDVWEQVGITSNGIGCGRPGLPGLYTRVAVYQTWINDTMNSTNRFCVAVRMIFIPIMLLMLL